MHWVSGRGLGPHGQRGYGHRQRWFGGKPEACPSCVTSWLTSTVHPGPASRVTCNQNVAPVLLFGGSAWEEASPHPCTEQALLQLYHYTKFWC